MIAKPLRALRSWSEEAITPHVICLAVLIVLLLPVATGEQRYKVGAMVRQQAGHWVVTSVDDGGVAARAGLRVGDQIVAVDGAYPRAVRRTDPGLRLADTSEWLVLRGGEQLALRPSAVEVGWRDYLDCLILLVIALACWAVAAFVLLRKPDDALVRRFFRLNVAVAIVLALSSAAGNDVVWAKIVEVGAFAYLPALFLEFFLSFALGALGGRAAVLTKLVAIAGAVDGGLYLLAGFAYPAWYDPARAFLLALLAAAFLGGIATLGWAYLRCPAPRLRQQVSIVLLGAAGAVLPLTVLVLIPESLGRPPLVYPPFATLSGILLPLSFAVAILWRGFLGIDLVQRTIVYGSMTLLLAGCYALFFYGFSLLGSGEDDRGVLSLVFFAAMTTTFVPVHDRLHRLVDRLVYHDRYDYVSTLRSLGLQLASVRPFEEILATAVEKLAGAMNLRSAAVLLREPSGGLALRAACGEASDPAKEEVLLEQAMDWLHCGAKVTRGSYWVPLTAQGERLGLLYLGPKRSWAELEAEDLSLAETIASQMAVVVANALLVERLQAKVVELELLRDRLLRVQEDERKRLARDLHDGPLHTVLELVRRASLIAASDAGVNALGESCREQLSSLAERGRDAAHELRAICTDLYPSELSHLGLAAAIEVLARGTSRDETLAVRFSTQGFDPDQRLPGVIEDTLYRVVREALDNTCRHAAATSVEIKLVMAHGRVTAIVRDDGRGFAVPCSAGILIRKGHLGLVSMIERVERLGGELRIRSTPGAGTEVWARIPVPCDGLSQSIA